MDHNKEFLSEIARSARMGKEATVVLMDKVEDDKMRSEIRTATTVIGMASMLHTIATGNMTPSYRVMPDGTVREIYFYCVDIAEFAVNKLTDRGSLSARGIVTNVQDFVVTLAKGLGLWK